MADDLAHSPTDSTGPSSTTSPPPLDVKKRKGKNFTIPEDEQLCRSWLKELGKGEGELTFMLVGMSAGLSAR